MNRRDFLKSAALAGLLPLLPLGRAGWVAPAWAEGPARRMIVVFLRGAVDGLSVVLPHQEAAYYDVRPHIRIPQPGKPGGAIDLDGRFGMHPAMAALKGLFQDKRLAFVHACGSPDPTRSHFEAQDYMEIGVPGSHAGLDGWMNRLLRELPGPHTATSGVCLGDSIPRILSGPVPIANFAIGRGRDVLDHPAVEASFAQLYGSSDALGKAFAEAQSARKELKGHFDAIQKEMQAASHGAPPARGFAGDAQQLARLIRHDPGIRLAFLQLGGWDTHVNQGSSQGQLARALQSLSEGLAALHEGLGSAFADTAIVVMSEFGRTVHENGDAGTDHGHGNVMWLMGGALQGGRVLGRWPGLGNSQLYQKRDLAVTTDFRDVLAHVLASHFGLADAAIARVFPARPANAAPTLPKGLFAPAAGAP